MRTVRFKSEQIFEWVNAEFGEHAVASPTNFGVIFSKGGRQIPFEDFGNHLEAKDIIYKPVRATKKLMGYCGGKNKKKQV